MQLGEWIGLASLLVTNVGTAIGIYKYFNSKVDRVYERFDEFKKTIKVEFVQKELCKIMHENSSSNLNGLEKRITDSVGKLEKKVDDNFKVVIDLMKK
jgi:hypothetical protein